MLGCTFGAVGVQIQQYETPSDTAPKYPKAILEKAGTNQLLQALEEKTHELEVIKQQTAVAQLDDKMHHKERYVLGTWLGLLLLLIVLVYFMYHKSVRSHNKTMSGIIQYQSHELRSPLVKIMGLVSELQKSELAKDAESKKQLEMLEQSADELDAVIHKIVKRVERSR